MTAVQDVIATKRLSRKTRVELRTVANPVAGERAVFPALLVQGHHKVRPRGKPAKTLPGQHRYYAVSVHLWWWRWRMELWVMPGRWVG